MWLQLKQELPLPTGADPGVCGREGQTTLSPVGEDFAVVEHLDLQDLIPIDIACHRPAEGLWRKDGREMSGFFQGAAAEVTGMELFVFLQIFIYKNHFCLWFLFLPSH